MNILIVFDTYSGGTLDAATFVHETLSKNGHTSAMKRVSEVSPEDFSPFEFIIFGTPSWMVDKKDGQPHINFKRILETTEELHLKDKNVAIFGLGDESYAHFAGGTDVLMKFVQDRGGIIVSTPLKMDSYYATQEISHQKLNEWIETLFLSL